LFNPALISPQDQEIRMHRLRPFCAVTVIVLAVLAGLCPAQKVAPTKAPGKAVLWTEPGDIRSRNLFFGPGGEEGQPQEPVEFQQEDTGGTSPKFTVRDTADKKWTAKLGLEAQPETAATRLLWSIGYTANENYFFPQLHVKNMPATLHRGQDLAGRGGEVPSVRLQRHPGDYKRTGKWNWRHNPFYGTREFNGLRVVMGLIGNWDLKHDNNAILEDEKRDGPVRYEVSDVGTAFGTSGKSYSDKASKGNRHAYHHERLVSRKTKDHVDLNFPKIPIANVFEFKWIFVFHQLRIRWVGKHIPREDARWVGSLLAQLNPGQIRDAFRAAGYSDQEVADYTQSVISRIQELNAL
jgi:hypothetical protein